MARDRPMLAGLRIALWFTAASGWLVSGCHRPSIERQTAWVNESSMAPGLRGAHQQVICAHCQHEQAVAAYAREDVGADAVCEACGQAFPLPIPPPIHPGSRIGLTPWRPNASVARWQRVTFAPPQPTRHDPPPDVNPPATLWIKRVVGLPGEHVTLQHGDVVVNGQIARKTLAQFRAQSILLADVQNVQLTTRRAPRWRGTAVGGDQQWEYRGAQVMGRSVDQALIWDDLTYEPLRSQPLTPVRDVLIRVQLHSKSRATGTYQCVLQIGMVTWTMCCDGEHCRVRLLRNGEICVERPLPGHYVPRRLDWEIAHCDRQLYLAINGRTLLHWPDNTPVAAGADRVEPLTELRLIVPREVRIQRLRLWRDLAYQPLRAGLTPQWQLGADEYVVLGDNPAASIDSRQLGPLPATQMRGIVAP